MSSSGPSGVIDPSILGDEPASTFKEVAAPAPLSRFTNTPAAEASTQPPESTQTRISSDAPQTEAETETEPSLAPPRPAAVTSNPAQSSSAADDPEPGEVGAEDEGEPAHAQRERHLPPFAHTSSSLAQNGAPSYLQPLLESPAAVPLSRASSSQIQRPRQPSPSPWDSAPIGTAWSSPALVSSDSSSMTSPRYDAHPSSSSSVPKATRYSSQAQGHLTQPPRSSPAKFVLRPRFTPATSNNRPPAPNPWEEEEQEAGAPASRDFDDDAWGTGAPASRDFGDDAWGTPAPQGSSFSQSTSPWGEWSRPPAARGMTVAPKTQAHPSSTPGPWAEEAQLSGVGPSNDWPESSTSHSAWPSESTLVLVQDDHVNASGASNGQNGQQQSHDEHAEPSEALTGPRDNQGTSEPPVPLSGIDDQPPTRAAKGSAERHFFTTRHLPPIVSGHRPPPATTAMLTTRADVASHGSKRQRVRFYKGEDQEIPDPAACHRTAQEKARQRASVAASAAANKKKPKPKPKTKSMPKARSETPAFQPSGMGSRTRRSTRQPSSEHQPGDQVSQAPQLLGGGSASELGSHHRQEQQAIEHRPSPATKGTRRSLQLIGPVAASSKVKAPGPASASKQPSSSSSTRSNSRATSQPKPKAPSRRAPLVVPSSDEDSDDAVMGDDRPGEDDQLDQNEDDADDDDENDPDHFEEVSESETKKNSPKRPADLVRRPQQQQAPSNARKRKEPEQSESNAVVLVDQHQKEDDIMAEVLSRHIYYHDWEPLIDNITTAELHPVRKTLQFFIEWKDGSKSWVPHQHVYGRAPQRCLKFYESRIRFGSNPPSPPPGFDASKSKSPAPPQKKRKR